MSAESKRPRQQTEANSEKNSPQTRNTSADHEARARDIREKMQYLRSLRAKVEKKENDKHGGR
jgi:hypothetical protein